MGRVHGFLKLPTSRAKLLCVKDIGSSRGKEATATEDVCDSNKEHRKEEQVDGGLGSSPGLHL